MEEKDRFQGAYKTMKGSYKEFNGLCALWFSYGFKNNYKITKEQDKRGSYFAIWEEGTNKVYKKVRLK